MTNNLKKSDPLLLYSRSLQVAPKKFRILELFSVSDDHVSIKLSLPEADRLELEASESVALRQLKQSEEVRVCTGF